MLNNSQGYSTNDILSYCIPDTSSILSSNDAATYGGWELSLYESRWVIFTCIWISLAFAFFYLVILRFAAVPLAYITILVIQVALVLMGYYAYA